jgi:hypothetical protein
VPVHSSGPAADVAEREVVVLAVRDLVVQDDDAAGGGVDAFDEGACDEQVRQAAFVEQPDEVVPERARQPAVVDPDAGA